MTVCRSCHAITFTFTCQSHPLSSPAYLPGFGGHFATEAVPGALPQGRNSPQRPAFGLYAEQLSGSAFTAPRHENRRSWLYRMRPTADHPPYRRYGAASLFAPATGSEPVATGFGGTRRPTSRPTPTSSTASSPC